MNRQLAALIGLFWLPISVNALAADPKSETPLWTASHNYRFVLTVDARNRKRSHSPVVVDLDFRSTVRAPHVFDEHSVEVIALKSPPGDRRLVPHRIDRRFGSNQCTLNFVMPDDTYTLFAVYFSSAASNSGWPKRYPGLVGDGDLFRETFQQREIAASHFDQLIDFDNDGDLDLFQGGVEPYVHCWENAGDNRLVPRGRLSNGGEVFRLPCSNENRSWVTVAFFDIDGDGDQDFFPSFNDGPDTGRIIFYRNTTLGTGELTFTRVGPLTTDADQPLAGGGQAGGWFPSICFVRDWDGHNRGRVDAIVGSNNRCWLYRGLGADAEGKPKFAIADAVHAGGKEISLVNPRFEVADIDSDGDLDLFAGSQPGPVWWFENTGTRATPVLAAGRVLAFDEKYLIGDAHSGVKVADFNRDGLLDVIAGRFWERTPLDRPEQPREFARLLKNIDSRSVPRFERDATDVPFTEQYQMCDAVRQNGVRAVDWDRDGKMDLLAGDTDGFVWFFRNQFSPRFAIFARGEKITAGGELLSVASHGGHARFDVNDWDEDGFVDLLVADGHGTLTLFRNTGKEELPVLEKGQPVLADGQPVHGGPRASVLVCDWNHDGLKDIVFADEKGFYWYRNTGSQGRPRLSRQQRIDFAGQPVKYVRPNLGSFVDWDGDGRRDFIGCHFENSIRLYRNLGSAGSEPQFENTEGLTLLKASSPQMISGADAVDWNGDGDIDLLTGQGHGGSGLRFFERDWIDDELQGTHPRVTNVVFERKPR